MRNSLVFISLAVILAASVFFSTALGSVNLNPAELLSILFAQAGDANINTIVWQLRLPRVMMGMVTGASLAACGVVFQAVLRNPLAEPYTLGVSGGGALGATISIMLGLSGLAMVGMCFLGCCLTIMLVLGLASLRGFSNTMLILCGVIIGFLLSSVMMLLFSLSTTRDVYASVMWLMGSLSAPGRVSVMIMVFIVLPFCLALNLFSAELNILSLGDEKAMHLGLNAGAARLALFAATSVMTGACVAMAGVISFVGLIVPHIMRKAVGPDHKLVLPASMLAGAILLVLSDTAARLLIRPMELPVGVITGIAGGLFFLALLFRQAEESI